MRLAFMGTADFALPALHALTEAGHAVVRVYTRPPRRAGRGRSLRPSPVHAAAGALGIPVATPESIRDPAVLADFAALECDAAVVVAYGQILPRAALTRPASAVSTCTPRCCRAGAGRRRSSARSWPATRPPGSA